ncbi:MAG TPA: hypothetical protein VGF24_29405 [Vicinamibacterales bacterium]
MAAGLDLKLAIVRRQRTQRDVALATRIPEARLSEIVRGLVVPNSTERTALADEMGEDYFAGMAVGTYVGRRSRG